MSRSSGRGQVEPLAALVAVVAVCLALSAYVGVLDARLPGSPERSVAATALERVDDAVAPAGVAVPGRVGRGPGAGPDGYATNVTLLADGRRWRAGPEVPTRAAGDPPAPQDRPDPADSDAVAPADVATEPIGVRVAPAAVEPGRLVVRVWS